MTHDSPGYTTRYTTPDGVAHGVTTFDGDVVGRKHRVEANGAVTTTTTFDRESKSLGNVIRIGETTTEISWGEIVRRGEQYRAQLKNSMREGNNSNSEARASHERVRIEKRTIVDGILFFLRQLRNKGVDVNQILDSEPVTDTLRDQLIEILQVDGEPASDPENEPQKSEFTDEIISSEENVDSIVYKRTFKDGHSIFIKQAKNNDKVSLLKNEVRILRRLSGQSNFPEVIEEMPEGFENGLFAFSMTEVAGKSLEVALPELSVAQKTKVFLAITSRLEELAKSGVVHNDLYNSDNVRVSVGEGDEVSVAFIDFSRGEILDDPQKLHEKMRDPMYGDVTNISWALQKALGGELSWVSGIQSTDIQSLLEELRMEIRRRSGE